MLLDGRRLIHDACAAGVRIQTALLSAQALDEGDGPLWQLAQTLREAGVQTLLATRPVLAAASPVRTPSGAIALAVPSLRTWEEVMSHDGTGLIVAAIGVQDPGNIGAIVRSADAAGARGVIAVGSSADPYGWRALRGSMGSTFRVPVAVVDTLEPVVRAARDRHDVIVATVPRGGQSLYDADLRASRLLLVGPEGSGLEREMTASTDLRVSIPMRPGVDSLNVAVATALVVYEARRQRLPQTEGHAQSDKPAPASAIGP